MTMAHLAFNAGSLFSAEVSFRSAFEKICFVSTIKVKHITIERKKESALFIKSCCSAFDTLRYIFTLFQVYYRRKGRRGS